MSLTTIAPKNTAHPPATTDDLNPRLRETALRYQADLGWDTDIIGNQLFLTLGKGLVGASMAREVAGEVNHQLKLHGLGCPVLHLPGPRDKWVFLACYDIGSPLPSAPYFITVLRAGERIPLPPSSHHRSNANWVVPPDRSGMGSAQLAPLLALSKTVIPLKSLLPCR
jgi:hypothetical protein